ncbi:MULTISPECIES: helix-turn-helix domain-containing protein [Kitasatospora]|uniref:helix-turn-helix domain-containing protein n=1 Tax=Kitasatospora TaxID=2063 RepID=UPI0004C403B4|nr:MULTISPECIES: helix-turn-helix domain-containing protein [unclassified Kitasatospora]WAL75223.1 helix-turn-helix domain-containing protein [Kitasatospora sp. YST-16]WNW41280.1 helix-turn-helix domain-containing protein [Streptomyces sp. Li-HN-5-13]
MSDALDHPLTAALRPLLDAVGATAVAPAEARAEDVVLEWDGAPALAVRLPHLSSALDRLLAEMVRQFDGRPLTELDRADKQRVVALLEERGAFTVRHGVETVASALGVSRFTVYNYLNRQEKD